jgi:hypothetical protein
LKREIQDEEIVVSRERSNSNVLRVKNAHEQQPHWRPAGDKKEEEINVRHGLHVGRFPLNFLTSMGSQACLNLLLVSLHPLGINKCHSFSLLDGPS